MQTLKAEVDSFHNDLVAANAVLKGGKSNKSGSSTELEANRIALGTGLYGVLGLLMNFYKETPEMIADTIQIDILRTMGKLYFSKI